VEAEPRDDPTTAAEVRDAKDVRQGRHEKIDAGEAQQEPAGLGLGDLLDQAGRIDLGAGPVVAALERHRQTSDLAADVGAGQLGEHRFGQPGRHVPQRQQPDVHGRSMPNFFILL
jgi:hypothetical protein